MGGSRGKSDPLRLEVNPGGRQLEQDFGKWLLLLPGPVVALLWSPEPSVRMPIAHACPWTDFEPKPSADREMKAYDPEAFGDPSDQGTPDNLRMGRSIHTQPGAWAARCLTAPAWAERP
ncbi:hypothetical protein CB1_001038003 [Camelus ferus]|nr:hypothetical protein CB1_001038003 [Camelus ferus]